MEGIFLGGSLFAAFRGRRCGAVRSLLHRVHVSGLPGGCGAQPPMETWCPSPWSSRRVSPSSWYR